MNAGRSLLAAAAVAATIGTATTPAVFAAPTPGTVVIVPGQYIGALPYQPMKAALERSGYRVDVLSLAGLDLRADASAIGTAVDRARANGGGVSLVGHSVGGLSARYYLKALGGAPKVARYVAIGTAQYGSPAACSQSGTAREVCPGSGFLTTLNSGVGAAGPTQYYSIRSAKEWADGRITGPQCRMTPVPSATGNGGFDHTLEPVDPRVIAQVQAAVAGRCEGVRANDPAGSIRVENTLYPAGKAASGG
ncbi:MULTISPECIES: esterase/lipase family protein [Tsukamurella]|uniref:Lipase n=2 Tax=Tsukamurella TaxID=2060 RepID=A0A5C5S2H0_9ACTN|nr:MULTISPECIES: lipase [Tsukamurella]NMD54569.1 lipase [Tsukamurella columbiensis]TWS28491.1 lipase [Tsukamurella conjunctivitidis]